MKTVTLEQFVLYSLRVIENYQSDLNYDIDLIKAKKPSIFFAYENGSHCIRLKDFSEYPDAFTRVPYLFGTANREYLLDQTGATMQCESVSNAKLIHYFDGEKIRRIDYEMAQTIILHYKLKMQKQFERDNGIRL